MTIDTPRKAHDMAYAAAWDAVSSAQRARIGKGSRAKRLPIGVGFTPLRMTPSDRALFCDTVGRWYSNFNILNAGQWMPEGYEWQVVDGDWKPVNVSEDIANGQAVWNPTPDAIARVHALAARKEAEIRARA